MGDDDVLRAERALADEGRALADDLGLLGSLGELGVPTVVGAVAFGVAVRRDLDITTACPALDEPTTRSIALLGASLALHPLVRSVVIRDDTGRWNQTDTYPDGVYLGLTAARRDGAEWTFDLWFVDEPGRQPDLAHLARYGTPLADDARRTILAIKSQRSSVPTEAASFDIYRAVLDGGVRTADEFSAWWRAHA